MIGFDRKSILRLCPASEPSVVYDHLEGGGIYLKVLVCTPSTTIAILAIYPTPHRSKLDRGDHRESIKITIEQDFLIDRFSRQTH